MGCLKLARDCTSWESMLLVGIANLWISLQNLFYTCFLWDTDAPHSKKFGPTVWKRKDLVQSIISQHLPLARIVKGDGKGLIKSGGPEARIGKDGFFGDIHVGPCLPGKWELGEKGSEALCTYGHIRFTEIVGSSFQRLETILNPSKQQKTAPNHFPTILRFGPTISLVGPTISLVGPIMFHFFCSQFALQKQLPKDFAWSPKQSLILLISVYPEPVPNDQLILSRSSYFSHTGHTGQETGKQRHQFLAAAVEGVWQITRHGG